MCWTLQQWNGYPLNPIITLLRHALLNLIKLIEQNLLYPCTEFNRSSLFFIEVVMFCGTWSLWDCRHIFKRTPALICVLDLFPQLLSSIPPSVQLGLQRTGNPIDSSRDWCGAPVIWLSCLILIMNKAGSKPVRLLLEFLGCHRSLDLISEHWTRYCQGKTLDRRGEWNCW